MVKLVSEKYIVHVVNALRAAMVIIKAFSFIP